MKSILFLSLLFVSISTFGQKVNNKGQIVAKLNQAKVTSDDPHITSGGSTALLDKAEQAIYILPILQNDIKSLNDQMKPYEEIVKEYNRLLGLKVTIYQTIIKSKGIRLDSLIAEPIFLSDSIKVKLKGKK